MPMNELINMLVNSGIAVVVVAFFMYRDIKFMSQLQQTLQTLVDAVDTLKILVTSQGDLNE